MDKKDNKKHRVDHRSELRELWKTVERLERERERVRHDTKYQYSSASSRRGTLPRGKALGLVINVLIADPRKRNLGLGKGGTTGIVIVTRPY